MAQHFDIRQRNNLYVGNSLAAEVPASTDGRRAFVVIQPYREDSQSSTANPLYRRPKPFSKFLNVDHSDIEFNCSVFEVIGDDLTTYLREAEVSWDAKLDIHALSVKSRLPTLEEAEAELARYLDDFSTLDVSWRVLPW